MMYLKRKENKMDFTQFVNSKDIRKHLQDIGYEFNALEAAWLVYQCKNATLEEKHEAWRYIIDNMPDMEFPENPEEDKYPSLHCLLRDHIEKENFQIEQFSKSKRNVIYRYEVYFFLSDQWEHATGAYTTYENCVNTALNEIGDNINRILISKEYLDTPSADHINIILRNDGSIMSVERCIYSDLDSCNLPYLSHLSYCFDSLRFSFPVPFKKGDILCDPSLPDEGDDYGRSIGPFVMTDISAIKHKETGWISYGSIDMNVQGYFQLQSTGNINRASMLNYMNAEYYPKEKLTGKRQVLQVVSTYIKGKIDLELFARTYHQILCEDYAEGIQTWFDQKEGLGLT